MWTSGIVIEKGGDYLFLQENDSQINLTQKRHRNDTIEEHNCQGEKIYIEHRNISKIHWPETQLQWQWPGTAKQLYHSLNSRYI